MMRFGLLCGLVFLAISGRGAVWGQGSEAPRVLFLFADDHCYEALGALGAEVATPHLDRLAARSVRFSRAYNMGSWSAAVCVASRTMLNTGRYLWRAQAVDKTLAAERDAGRLWPQRMKAAGYRTFLTGKWHVAVPPETVFDVTRHVRGGMPKTVESAYNRPLPGVADGWSPFDKSLGGFWEGGRHWSEVTADDAIAFLQEAKAAGPQPFFIYAAFNAPHDPRQAPEAYVRRYPAEKVRVPGDFLPEYPHAEAMGAGRGLRDERLAPFPRTPEAVRVHRGEYFALIEHLDAQIGRVLDALEASGEAGRTWVFFTADHGLAVGHHGLMGKQNMYEHSLRVPFLVTGPGVKPGVVEAPVYLQDVMATCLDLAGAERQGVEFQSLLPLIRRETEKGTAVPVYGAYLDRQRAIVDGGWKLIVYPKAGVVRLYNLAQDPEERRDLAPLPEAAAKRRQLLTRLRETMRAMGDKLTLDGVQ